MRQSHVNANLNQTLNRSFVSHVRASSLFKPSTLHNESFANGTNSIYFDQMYEAWRRDPNSVHTSWRNYFNNVEGGAADPYTAPPTLGAKAVS